MAYPNFKNKHLEEELFGPHDYCKFRERKKQLPKKLIITYQTSVLSYFKRKYKGKYRTLKISSNLHIHIIKGIGITKMTGIGAPHAAAYLEELICMGVNYFINMGTAGGLKNEGIFLCEKSIRDEGTSYHYLPHRKYSYPDKELTKKLEKSISKKRLNYEKGISWTIDTPYRETKAEIQHYKNEGVATVEMESSALFAVARLRNVRIASAFVVSDILGEKWDPKFHHMNVKKSLNSLLEACIDCLKNINRKI